MLNSCTHTRSGTLVNLFDTMNENNKIHSTGIINIQFITIKRDCSLCGFRQTSANRHMHKLRQYAHTHKQYTVAERITQQISDPLNYMWPLPEIRGHS